MSLPKSSPPASPSLLTVEAQRLAPEGEAIALEPGSPRVVFVPYAVPGDRLEVRLEHAKSSFARARITRLLSPGPERVEPSCPLHFRPGRQAPACGGCDWQQLGYEAQLRHKREIVLDCLRRIAKLPETPVAATIPSPQPWGYRNKVQVPFGKHGGRLVAGFYAPASHEIVDFEACPVQPELSVSICLKIKDLARRFQWPVYDAKSGRGWLRHLFVRSNAAGQALIALVSRSPDFPRQAEFVSELRSAFPEIVSLYHNVQPEKTSVVLGPAWRHLWGGRHIEERIGPFSFLVSPGAFLQVNTPAAERLYAAALAALKEDGKGFGLVLDLYSGAGTLALWAAKAFPRVLGIEESREAVRDAWKNAERNSVKNARFSIGRVEAVLPRIKDELPEPTAVLADPPRAGLSQAVLRLLTHRRIQRLVYVSCNPATFARDAGFLAHSGFALKRVQPVDLFPQTSHVELVGLLDRS